MDNDKIYIIVPVYKVEPYLERCVDSILKQTYTNWELVLVDDGSPDNCPAICDRYAAEHGNITVIHQDNGGVSAARNTGVEYALKHGDLKNNWINFIDSDDFVHPCYLEYLYRAAAEAGVDISSCGYVRGEANDWDSADLKEFKFELISPEVYMCKNKINADVACGKLYRLFLFESVRYPVGKVFEDTATTYKVLFDHSEIAVVFQPLYYWYLNHCSISQSAWTPSRIDKLEALESQISFFENNGFPAAYKKAVEELFINVTIQIRSICALSPQYDDYIENTKRIQNRAMKLYAKEFGFHKALTVLFDIRIRRPFKRMLRDETVFQFLKRRIKKLFSRIKP